MMRMTLALTAVFNFAVSTSAQELDKFNGLEKLTVGETRLAIANNGTYQCGQRLVFSDTPATLKNAEVTFSVKTVPADKGECGCKSHTHNFHLYRSNRIRVDEKGYSIPDELIAKGKLGPAESRTFKVAAINRVEVKFDYYIKFLCTD
jgi:hypothetical protein